MDHLKVQNEHDESSDGEIIEDISRIEEYEDSDADDIPIFLKSDSDFAEKKRQLFDIEGEDKFFLEDVDKILSPDNIAKHFKTDELEESKENIVPVSSEIEKLQKHTNKVAENCQKELSPLNEDIILINDKKVSISSLKKKVQGVPYKNEKEFSSLNFSKIPPSVSLRTSHSLDLDLNDSSDESFDNENEVLANDHVQKTISTISIAKDEEQSDSKKMEKITPDYLKEPLDDITEESETESKEQAVSSKISLIEKGSQCRTLLHNSLFVTKKDEQKVDHNNSLDLQNKSLKELQDIVIEKDSCLDALNLQLNALIRRENLKDLSGRESLKESVPYSFVTTTSTEYRTINEDFNFKILDIENELHDRAMCIENLKLQLSESNQERKKQNEEILKLQSKIAGIDSVKSSCDDKTIISASKINDFCQFLSEEEAACFKKVWVKFEIFHENEIEKIKLDLEQECKKLKNLQINEKKESNAEISRLKQLISTINSPSPALNEIRRELENKHQKEMGELREYFEKRCLDMEKQYSEEVFSQHSRKIEESEDVSDNETIPDDETGNAMESFSEKINEIITVSKIYCNLTLNLFVCYLLIYVPTND
jgi:hypothetical protein